MTNTELKQLRRLMFLEASEAAQFIGNCETRTWQRWEKGDRAIPLDVIQTMQMLALTRAERLQVEFDAKDPSIHYFENFDEYKAAGGGGNELMWRLAQSVATALLVERDAESWREDETIVPENMG